MICSTCGAENPSEAEYCANCGVPLSAFGGRSEGGQAVVYCTNCGTENAHAATVCMNCGAPLQAIPERDAPLHGELSASGGGTLRSEYLHTTGVFIPRNLDGLLGETFKVYRGNFLRFYLIALVAQVPSLIGQIAPMPLGVIILFFVVGYVAIILAAGATIYAVASQYLGRETNIGQCYARAWNRVVSLLGSTLIFILASAILIALVIGIPLFFYILVRWFFYAEAIIIEGKRGPREALGRSHELVRGSWWRVFGIGVVFVVLIAIVGLVASIPGSIAANYNSPAGSILLSIFGSAVTPIGFIGSALVYFDLRVRNETYTLGTMASEVDA